MDAKVAADLEQQYTGSIRTYQAEIITAQSILAYGHLWEQLSSRQQALLRRLLTGLITEREGDIRDLTAGRADLPNLTQKGR